MSTSISSKWSVLLALVLVGSIAACSKKDEDQARKTVEQVKDKTEEIAAEAADKTKEAVSEVADKGKEIVSSTGEAITDGWITAKINLKFSDEKLLKDTRITVDTSDRVVTLKGTVGTDAAKKRAVMIASGTEGVLRVIDQVAVKAK
jgi:osmotically-inducible protein OsmY